MLWPSPCGGGDATPSSSCSSTTTSSTTPQQQLPSALQLHILSLLPVNDRALSGRLACRDICDALSGRPDCIATLSQPLPPHAAAWAPAAGQHHMRQLCFRHKLRLLCTAAASGLEANLEVALAWLQPSVFPDLLQSTRSGCWYKPTACDPGEAAVKAGHPQVLGWLLRHCPGLVSPEGVLMAAAQHCDLTGLKAAWKELGDERWGAALSEGVLNAAAGSATPAAVKKMEWVLSISKGRCRLTHGTAEAAVRSGDLWWLQWLHGRGCPMGGTAVLKSALEHAELAVAQWLVDEAGYKLPAAGSGSKSWASLALIVATTPDGVAKLQWLQEQGAPPLRDADDRQLQLLVEAAAGAGQVEVVRYLLGLRGPGAPLPAYLENLVSAGAASGSIAMVEYLRQAGFGFTAGAYGCAAARGSVAMYRWLAHEAGAPATGIALWLVLKAWPHGTPANSRDLLEAVQLLQAVGCHARDWCRLNALRIAALRGDVPLMHYLARQPGFQPDWHSVLTEAAQAGCEALLEWLGEAHPSCYEYYGVVSAYLPPARVGNLGTLTALRRLGVPWGWVSDVVARAVSGRYAAMSVVRWFVDNGAPVGSSRDIRMAVAESVKSSGANAKDWAWLLKGVANGTVAYRGTVRSGQEEGSRWYW